MTSSFRLNEEKKKTTEIHVIMELSNQSES